MPEPEVTKPHEGEDEILAAYQQHCEIVARLGKEPSSLEEFKKQRAEIAEAMKAFDGLSEEELEERALEELGKLDEETLNKLGEAFTTVVSEVLAPTRTELIGQELEISGPTLDRDTVDIKDFKGQVVLVQFWSTMCMPCRAEVPHLKELYQRYHERGFEIISVPLDRVRENLTKAIEEEGIDWPQIFFGNEENPLVKKYQVNAVPLLILVGREGKVVEPNARGPRLIKALEDLF